MSSIIIFCKIKHIYPALILILLFTTTLIYFFQNDMVDSRLQVFVEKTKVGLKELKENLRLEPPDSFESSATVNDNLNEKYTDLFHYNYNGSDNRSVTVVSLVTASTLPKLTQFLHSINTNLPNAPILVYNTDLKTSVELETGIADVCNNTTRCTPVRFDYDRYPEFIKDEVVTGVRPIILQTTLLHSKPSCVLLISISKQLLPSFTSLQLSEYLKLSLTTNGIIGFSTKYPTSSQTHTKMFNYFQARKEDYYFHHMIGLDELILCRTKWLLERVMTPWLQCTLTKSCISPPGSQSNGCRYDKKPLYRYSGCHNYDVSAINVILGLVFPINQPYVSRAVITTNGGNGSLS